MYKIYKCWYNDGGWHSGPLPTFYYIAESEEEVKQNSNLYAGFLECKNRHNGYIYLGETKEVPHDSYIENYKGFEITVSVRKVE